MHFRLKAGELFREQHKLSIVQLRGNVMSYILYIAGFAIIISGLVYGAILLHVPAPWIIVSSLVLLGIAISTGVKATRQKDPVK
jgi:Ca2+/Na+ antiporter